VSTQDKKSKQPSTLSWNNWKDSQWWKDMVHSPGQRPFVRWTPAPSASWSFMAACFKTAHPERPLVVVTSGLKLQESMHQDLTTWLRWFSDQEGPSTFTQPYFFPAWEHLPHEAKLPHADVLSERLETLSALLQWQANPDTQPAPVIVTTIQALMQRTFEPNELQERTRTLQVGDEIDPLDLVEWLEDQAYEPEAKVTQKGEIALRGGILDVFPLSSPMACAS
jgi:transcription-repair coupling factor (superfamily II helicase)